MRRLVLLLVVGAFAVMGVGLVPVVAKAEEQAQTKAQTQDQWRFVFFNNEWWYWLPEGRWVYWRENRWNNYDPKAVVPNDSAAVVSGGQVGAARSSQGFDSENRPFYGHADSTWGYYPSGGDEAGPFYGHAMPGEVFDGWGWRRSSIRPFYGRAAGSPYGE